MSEHDAPNQTLKELSVIAPVYNEAENLPLLYTRVKTVMDRLNKSYEIILVDDGSSDSSYEILMELSAIEPRLKVIKFSRNFGQTAALAAGIEMVSGEIIITIDADLQNDPEDIPLLLEKMSEGADVVSGWRKYRKDPLLTRKIPSWCANWLISKLSGVPLHDYGCTLKAYRAKNLKRVSLYGEMHRFIPALVACEGAIVQEIPVRHHERSMGESKYGLLRIFRVVFDLLLVMFVSGYGTRPIHLFGYIAAVTMTVGTVIGLFTFYQRYVEGIPGINLLPLVLLSMFLLVASAQIVLIGLLCDLMMRTYFESQGKKPYVIQSVINGNT